MEKLCVQSRVRIIPDSLLDLDCDKKHIVLSDGSMLPYDRLVLCPGLQDQTAGVLGVDITQTQGLLTASSDNEVDEILGFVV